MKRRDRMMRDLDEDIRGHIAIETQDNIERGMSPEDARRAAILKFGSATRVREDVRELWSLVWFEQLLQDIRYGVRTLSLSPGFTAVAVLTLALGIGANTTIFSAVNGILLHRLPYPHSEELAELSVNKFFPGTDVEISAYLLASGWEEIRNQSPAIARLAVWKDQKFTLTGGTAPEIVQGAEVSDDFFPLLGVSPLLGRIVTASDTQPAQGRVAVLSYALWKELGGDRSDIQNRKIILNDQTYSVIGVMPPDFEYAMGEQRDRKGLWVPLIDATIAGKPSQNAVHAVVRLKKGTSLAAFNAQLKAVTPRVSDHWSELLRGGNLLARDLKPDFGEIQIGLEILMGAVSFVLLIACVNVSALLLGRSFGRQREIAVREALGAGRLRLVRQFLTESILLSVAGGALGILFAVWGVSALRAIAPADTMGIDRLQIDATVLWFTVGVSLLTGIVFGIAPALHASAKRSGTRLNESLSGSLSRYQAGSRRLRGALVVFEIALAVVLVIGATLVARSFEKLASVELGFRTDHILTMSMTFSPSVCDASKGDQSRRCMLAAKEVLHRVQQMPGVETAAAVSSLPLKENTAALVLTIEGQKETSGLDAGNLIAQRSVSPEYFQAVGMRMLKGRNFSDADTQELPPVAVVNESFARRFFTGDPIGRRFSSGVSKNEDGSTRWTEIIGVVADSRDNFRTDLSMSMNAEFYLAFGQTYFPGSAHLMLRTNGDPRPMAAAVREQIWSVDKNAPVADVKTMDTVVTESVAAPRFRSLLLGAFGALGLLLAMIGIYGVISYAVTQRTREIGVRMALGARPRDVVRLVLGEGMILAAIGIGLGLAGAFALAKIMESVLYDIKPRDPATFVAVSLAVAAAAAAACYIPARRAMRVDPMVALKYE
jgi:predicted permease